MKEGLLAFTSDEVAGLRIAIAFLFLLPLFFKHYKKIDFKKDWLGLVLMGTFGNLLPAFLFTKAETEISSSLTSMINALTPLFTIVIGIVVFKTKVKKFQILGVAIGLIGALLLLGFDAGSGQSKNVNFSMLVVMATICYAISVNGIKKYLSEVNSVTATVGSFAIIGPIAIIYLFTNTDFHIHLTQHPKGYSAFGFVCLLAIFGTSLSVMMFNDLIKQAGTVFASACTYLIPVVAIAWGLLDGETITLVQYVSVSIIILGVWLINKK